MMSEIDLSRHIKSDGTVTGINYVRPRGFNTRNRGAVIRVQGLGGKETMLGFGTTPAEFDANYALAVDRWAEMRGIALSEEQRAALLVTRFALIYKNKISTKTITVFDFYQS
jgi:hypothetical protein